MAEVLSKRKRKTFAEALSSVPCVGNDADFIRINDAPAHLMYLINTNIISEIRKGEKANQGDNMLFFTRVTFYAIPY
ncbi:MAG: hypothetical protein WCP01_10645 [Methylococcaceae bacterium]